MAEQNYLHFVTVCAGGYHSQLPWIHTTVCNKLNFNVEWELYAIQVLIDFMW